MYITATIEGQESMAAVDNGNRRDKVNGHSNVMSSPSTSVKTSSVLPSTRRRSEARAPVVTNM